MSRSPRQISLLIVSSNASRTRELRLSRFWYYMLVGLVCTGLTSMILLAVFSPYLAGVIMAETAGQPWKEQLKAAQDKTRQLNQELAEMKQIAKSIRQLAGVVDFESSAPDPVTEYTSFIDETAERTLSLRENQLPFLLHDRWIPVDESDLNKRQLTLFRSTPSIWPVRGWVTREFQNTSDPVMRRHLGMDFAAREGAPVLAAGDGIVMFSDWDQDLGWLVEVEHGYGFTTRYGHNSSLRVDRGQRIRRGQIIALVGNTGRSSAPHLHYEVWKENVSVNPRNYLSDVIRWDDLLGSKDSPGLGLSYN
jgi:murein DD-endopeptidase MepM/ murein hydrolase activator NlpD